MYKGILQSKTFWGLVLLALGPKLAKLGISNEEAETWIEWIIASFAFILGLIGRIKARTKIAGLVGPPKPPTL